MRATTQPASLHAKTRNPLKMIAAYGCRETRRNIQGMTPMAGIAESTAIVKSGTCPLWEVVGLADASVIQEAFNYDFWIEG